jgi:inorganic pyrophosphatase
MTTSTARHAILSETATFDPKTGELRVVIETPKDGRNKYDYDPDCDCLDLATVLPEGMSFSYYFGFVPSTLGEDGDSLDILA